jgi:hypothetical protein
MSVAKSISILEENLVMSDDGSSPFLFDGKELHISVATHLFTGHRVWWKSQEQVNDKAPAVKVHEGTFLCYLSNRDEAMVIADEQLTSPAFTYYEIPIKRLFLSKNSESKTERQMIQQALDKYVMLMDHQEPRRRQLKKIQEGQKRRSEVSRKETMSSGKRRRPFNKDKLSN